MGFHSDYGKRIKGIQEVHGLLEKAVNTPVTVQFIDSSWDAGFIAIPGYFPEWHTIPFLSPVELYGELQRLLNEAREQKGSE